MKPGDTPAPPAAVREVVTPQSLHEKLKAAADLFAMMREEPHFSTTELAEFVELAAALHARVAEAECDTERLDWLARNCVYAQPARPHLMSLLFDVPAGAVL